MILHHLTDFDPAEALKCNPTALLEQFVLDWLSSLPRDDRYALSLLLFHIFQQEFLLLVGSSAKIIAKYLSLHDETVKQWHVNFLKNDGEIPEFVRGKYKRMNAITNNEALSEEAALYVRQNAFKKGSPNMTARTCCSWVNNMLLP